MHGRAAAILRGNIDHHSELGRLLCTKTGEDQKNKVFTQKWNGFCVRTHFKSEVKSDIFCMPMPMGEGATLAFSANISLKSDKNVAFSILCMPVGEGSSSPRPPSPDFASGIRYLEAPLSVPRLRYA